MMCLFSWAFPCRAGLYAAIFLQKAKRISAAIPNAFDAILCRSAGATTWLLCRLLLLFRPAGSAEGLPYWVFSTNGDGYTHYLKKIRTLAQRAIL